MTDPDEPFDNKALTERVDLNFALQAAGMGVWEVDPTTNQVQWDERCGELFGISKSHQFLYQDTLQYIHPDDVHQVNQAVQLAMKFESGGSYSATYRIIREDGRMRWIRATGRSYFDPAGQLIRFAGVVQDVSQEVASRLQQQANEARFRSLIEEAPVSTCLFVGPTMIIEVVNEVMLGYWGRDKSVIGKPLIEALPELRDQPHIQILEEVYRTGKTYEARQVQAELIVNGELKTYYFDLIHKPLRNADGQVYGIMDMSMDVTDQVLARQKLEASEIKYRTLFTSIEDGFCIIEKIPAKEQLDFRYLEANPAFETQSGVGNVVGKTIRQAFPGESITSFEFYETILKTGQGKRLERILATQERVLDIYAFRMEDQAKPKVAVLFKDITARKKAEADLQQSEARYRALSAHLEQQVQERTEELAAANEELAATNEELEASNEEYAAINEELEEANSLLNRSNDSLQKFAYVASHDLQEPLRKIQQFGDLLKNQYHEQLGEGGLYLDRMQAAASRMSTLIKDLLSYSRLSSQRDSLQPVSLAHLVSMVLSDLELVIADTGAHLKVGVLPTVTGDGVQLGQLFQNLLSNALKFHQQGVAPQISITGHTLMAQELPPSVMPSRACEAYHRIDVADNGVGFDEKYLDRIFQVFQRLHGKSQFAGTGIGLAICERVVANHGGAITASSQPGQGATFSIYLPNS